MFALNPHSRLLSVAILAFSLAACAADPDPSTNDEPASPAGSSALTVLPAGAFSEANASIGGLGLGFGAVANTASVGTTGTVGTGIGGFTTNFGTGPMGGTTSFNSGPMGFNTGPITTSFNSGPMTMTTGGTTTMSSGSNGAPVVTTTCTGFGCP
jgi:hypothetical protein